MTRTGIVAEASIEVLAVRLSSELPGLEQAEIRRIARAQADDLKADGWRITAPVTAVATSTRRRKTSA